MRTAPYILCLTCILGIGNLFAAHAVADGTSTQGTAKPVSTPGSDASFDKRLPPVLPGEEVSDGNKKIKVWSTSGPVPVGQAPEPWSQDKWHRFDQGRFNRDGAPVEVIVDQRQNHEATIPRH